MNTDPLWTICTTNAKILCWRVRIFSGIETEMCDKQAACNRRPAVRTSIGRMYTKGSLPAAFCLLLALKLDLPPDRNIWFWLRQSRPGLRG